MLLTDIIIEKSGQYSVDLELNGVYYALYHRDILCVKNDNIVHSLKILLSNEFEYRKEHVDFYTVLEGILTGRVYRLDGYKAYYTISCSKLTNTITVEKSNDDGSRFKTDLMPFLIKSEEWYRVVEEEEETI